MRPWVNVFNGGERNQNWKKEVTHDSIPGTNSVGNHVLLLAAKARALETIVPKLMPCAELLVSTLCSACLKGLYGLIHPA
jgi:hypothetical protein